MHQLRSVLLFTFLLLLCVHPASAQEQQYELSNFDVTVHVRPDGAYEVEESITYDFQQGTFSYAYRSVVREGAGALRDLRVISPDTPIDSVTVTEEDDRRQVRWTFPSRSEPAQFDIRYVLEEAIYERGDRNLVSLEVMADGAVVPTQDVDVRVRLPRAFELAEDDLTIESADGELGREAGGLVARFRRGVVEEGDEFSVEFSFPRRITGEFLPTTGDIVFVFFLVVLGIGGGSLANWSWRGPRPQVEAHRPPSNVDLPTAAVLLQNRSGQIVPAVLLDLARRGHLTLEHARKEETVGSTDRVGIAVHPDETDLSDLESRLVDKVGEYETFDDFWSDTGSFRKEVTDDRRQKLVEWGWMEEYDVRSNVLAAAAVFFLFGGFAAIIATKTAATFYLLFGGMGLSIGSFIAALRRRVWTEDGARKGMALRSFLDHEKSEIERLRESDPVRAAERLVESLPWLLFHKEVSKSWVEETKEALETAGAAPEVPDGFASLVSDGDSAAVAAFLPIMGVMAAMEASGAGAAGAAGAAAAGGAAAGGGAGAAGAG